MSMKEAHFEACMQAGMTEMEAEKDWQVFEEDQMQEEMQEVA